MPAHSTVSACSVRNQKQHEPIAARHNRREKAARHPRMGGGRAEPRCLSERQRKTALRVANVPRDIFEEMVETDRPATITEFAERGKGLRPKPAVCGSASHLQSD